MKLNNKDALVLMASSLVHSSVLGRVQNVVVNLRRFYFCGLHF